MWLLANQALAGGIPLTNDDPNLEAAINSSAEVLDVLGNDDSGIGGDNFKEVIGLCDIGTPDAMCTGNSFSNGVGSVSINGSGDDNNVLFSSDTNLANTFDFKYVMQNSTFNTGAAVASVALNFIEVNDLSDNGSGGCDGSECTLREAISYAESDAGATTVKFNRTLEGTITLNAPLSVTSIDLSIIGPGPGKLTLSGNNTFRVLHVPNTSERFFLSGLTITQGRTTGSNPGAGIFIEAATDTQIENIRITNNQSNNIGGGLYVLNAGLTLRNSEISFNSAASHGGGVAISGGLGSDVTVENTTISNNSATGDGPGLYVNSNNGQNVTLRFVTAGFNGNLTDDNYVGANGNIIIESSVFTPMLAMNNTGNIVNNSVIENLTGSNILGDNNLIQTTDLMLNPLVQLNDSGLFVHSFNTDSLLYNHVDDMFGNAGCGTQVLTDQVGNSRPNSTACDAGAYEYTPANDIIFITGFE